MRKLTHIADSASAQALSALLEVNEITSEVRPSSEGHDVWVHDDDDLPRARELLAGYDPESARGLVAQAEKIRKKRQLDRRPVAVARQVKVSGSTAFGLGVAGLMLGCVLGAFVGRLGYVPALGIAPLTPLGIGQLDWSQPWRLVTPIFMHFGLFHILFNMLWLKRLGGQVEENHGTLGLLALVLFSAALSNFLQYMFRGPFFGGMSGVNYALFGFGWMQTRFGPSRAYTITQTDSWWLMGWLVLCATDWLGPIANVAHAVGLICGVSLGLPAYVRYRQTYKMKTSFAKGSWEDLNLKGFKRFRRLYVDPYAPAWLLFVALAVIWVDT